MALTNIGRYQITGELGKGAMGVVYKATDPNIGREVAIKTTRIDTHGIDETELLKRFKNEARAAGTLNHPGIVTIFDAGEDNGLFYIAMEYIEGTTLQKMLQQRRVLSSQQVVDFGGQICAGLDYAHSRGVVHRDIKPANIMITPSGAIKIMDFGIAKAGGGMTSTGQVLGTPNYMSPEQVKGRAVDGRSDIFSTGVVLYEALTGEKPFDGQNVTTIIYKIVNEMPISPRALDATVHPGLSLVILKALAKSPDERYQSGTDLAQDLTNYKTLGLEGGDSQVMSAATYVGGADTLISAGPLTVTSLRESTGVAAPPDTGAHRVTSQVPAAAAAKQALEPPLPVAPQKTKSKPGAGMSRPLKLALTWTPLFLITIFAGLYFVRKSSQQPQPAAPPQQIVQEQAQLPAQMSEVPPITAPTTPAVEGTSQEVAPPSLAVQPPSPDETAKLSREEKRKPAAEKPAAAKTQVGDLYVTSTPSGAKVTIEGRHDPAWVTPFTAAKLPVGAKAVMISKEGFANKELKTDVVAGKATTVDAQLAQSVAMINVRSTPPGADILLDDKSTGKTTPSLLVVPTGEHMVRVTKQGFEPASSTLKVSESQRLDFAPTLTASATPSQPQKKQGGGVFSKIFGKGENGTLQVRSNPAGAKVEITGTEKKTFTAPGKAELKPGKYDVTVSLGGHKSVKRAVTIEKGKTLGIEEALEKE
jgi:eukaryotic-like serine/threonine-protein kinase